jgi:competence protein ComEC
VQYGSNCMLIDAGGNATANTLVTTIKQMGITKFDVVVGTHPHEDHIGGLDAVITNLVVEVAGLPEHRSGQPNHRVGHPKMGQT